MPKRNALEDPSHESCSVVNKLLRSKYVNNSKRQRRFYQSTRTPMRTELNLYTVPRKKGATDFFAVTFTNIDGFS